MFRLALFRSQPHAQRAQLTQCALLAAACLLSSEAFSQAARSPTFNYQSIPKLEAIQDQPEAPDFALVALIGPDGKKVALKDYRGKLVLLNFWATWCGPCRAEMPAMQRLYAEFKGQGFEIVGVDVKDKRASALAMVKELGITYPNLFDPAGEAGLLYGAWGLPTSYLINRNGNVIARLFGPADWYSPAARNLVKSLLER